jgi:hypothetical protein
LLGLDCVRGYVGADPTERDYADALRQYLEDAVQRVESPERRVVLEVVLGLGQDRWKSKAWRHETVEARRREAGRRFRVEEDQVTPGTIRKVHEPHAIQDLAKIMLRDERAARHEGVEQEDYV